MTDAKVLLDSTTEQDIRLLTFRLRYPKYIHTELMTHRVFSRNASSSRAIPTRLYIEEARSDELRVTPHFGSSQKGMQQGEVLTGPQLVAAHKWWRTQALIAADQAEHALELGLHKDVINRTLEPYIHINVVVTSTEYMNWFGLRLDAGAKPEIRELAIKMWEAYNTSKPTLLKPGEWHLPYVGHWTPWQPQSNEDIHLLAHAMAVSVARIANVSYQSYKTKEPLGRQEAITLHDRLLSSRHLSPFEHQATPDVLLHRPITHWLMSEQHGNFTGWRQYRKTIPGEAITPLPAEFVQDPRDPEEANQ